MHSSLLWSLLCVQSWFLGDFLNKKEEEVPIMGWHSYITPDPRKGYWEEGDEAWEFPDLIIPEGNLGEVLESHLRAGGYAGWIPAVPNRGLDTVLRIMAEKGLLSEDAENLFGIYRSASRS